MNGVQTMAVLGGCSLALATAGADVCTLYDNGDADESNGYSNATSGVFGARRTVLDDFEVPENAVWTINGMRHLHIWNSLPPGSGSWMEIAIRADDGERPGEVIIPNLEVVAYREVATGRIVFNRAEAESWTTFAPIELPAGRYWLEATIVGPENNFWLSRYGPHHEACWTNYEDFGGLQEQFEPFWDLAWCFSGTTTACVGDVDGDETVGFADLLIVLQSWGASGGPGDVTNDGEVDRDDVFRVLASWGPCPAG